MIQGAVNYQFWKIIFQNGDDFVPNTTRDLNFRIWLTPLPISPTLAPIKIFMEQIMDSNENDTFRLRNGTMHVRVWATTTHANDKYVIVDNIEMKMHRTVMLADDKVTRETNDSMDS